MPPENSNTPPLFSVVIVNFNGGPFLQNAIDSLARQSCQDFELVLIDNASEDGSAETVDLSALPNARKLMEAENHGFAKGNNLAARQAEGEWLVLLNPDTVADEHWLASIAAAIKAHPGTRVFACAQLNMDDPDRLDGAGDAYHLFGIPWRGGFGRAATELPPKGHCFSPCGASAVYDKALFIESGGFDERFFCYCEDVDLGYRMQMAGHDCLFLPEAVIYHKGSGTSGQSSYFTMYHGNRNRTWLFVKNTPFLLLLLTLPGHLALIGYIYLRNRRSFEHSGMKDGLRDGFRRAWTIRQSDAFKAPARSLPWYVLIRRMAWNPFLMARRRCHVRPLRRPK